MPACTPWAADGVASVENRRIAVESELVLQARRRQNRLLRHLDHASCPSNLVARRLRFLDDVRKVDAFALAMIARWHWHAENVSPAFGEVSLPARCSNACQQFVDACELRKSDQALRYQNLAFLPRFPRRDSSVASGRTYFAAVLCRNSHRKGHHSDHVDCPHVLELRVQDSVWQSS